jgi:hypothetical protein
MQTQTAEKPRYLGLLNAISLAESHAGVYLEAWANATCDEELACTLRLVAAREKSHGEVFCRRLCELGYELRHKQEPEAAARIARYANPKISDLEKIGKRRDEDNTFSEIETRMAEGFYDPMTCNLLGWYICEERDSAKRLRAAFDCVRAKSNGATANGKSNGHTTGAMADAGPSADAQAIMACMSEGFTRLEKSIKSLSMQTAH